MWLQSNYASFSQLRFAWVKDLPISGWHVSDSCWSITHLLLSARQCRLEDVNRVSGVFIDFFRLSCYCFFFFLNLLYISKFVSLRWNFVYSSTEEKYSFSATSFFTTFSFFLLLTSHSSSRLILLLTLLFYRRRVLFLHFYRRRVLFLHFYRRLALFFHFYCRRDVFLLLHSEGSHSTLLLCKDIPHQFNAHKGLFLVLKFNMKWQN